MSEKPISCSWCRASNRADAKTCASCGAPLSQKPREKPATFGRALPRGTRLRGGDYELQDVIGQGRFGITYRALNHRLNRAVAIKEWFPSACERDGVRVLAGRHLSAEEFARGKAAFLEEARGLARFEHPAIVSLFAVWEENRSAYMEMELLQGPTLAQVLARFHHLKTDDALRLFAPILDALQQLHAQNWLHRDLNPHNIVLRGAAFEAADAATCVQNSRAVLIDFGAARQIAPDISQEFSVLVTPGYAPLEQYSVRARRAAASDIYALCATLYHALSGQIPPPAPDRANGTVLVPLRDLAPAVPQQFCRAIESGLETEIARRPQTVGDLQKLLPPLPVQGLAQAPLQVLAAPVPIVAPVEKSVEKAPQVLAALAAPDVANTPDVVNSATDKRTRNMLWAMGLGPFAFALLMGVLISRPSVEPHWSAPATRLIDEPVSDEPLGPPNAALYPPPQLLSPWRSQGKIAQIAFAPSGLLAGIDNSQNKDQGTIRIWDAQSGRVLRSLGTLSSKDSAEMAFSPNGKLLAIREVALDFSGQYSSRQYLSRGNSAIAPLSPTKTARPISETTHKLTQNLQQESARLSVVDVSSGKTLWKRTVPSSLLRWSRDGSELLLQISSAAITGCVARSGESFSLQEKMSFQLASDDARWFADFNSQTIRADYLDKSDGWQWKLDGDERLHGVVFAPDNSWLMGVGYYGVTARAASSASVDSAFAAKPVENSLQIENSLQSSVSGGRVWFFDLQTGKTINVWSGNFEDDSGAGFMPFFSPRGRYVGIKRFPNVLRIWEVRTHRDFAFRWPQSDASMKMEANSTADSTASANRNVFDLFNWPVTEFSPDENQILLGGTSQNLWLVDLRARTIRQAQLPSKSSEKSSENTPIFIKAKFTADNQYVVWCDSQTGKMGRLSVDDFNQKVPVEIIDGATSRPS